MIDIDRHVTQAEFGMVVGISQQAVSDLVGRGVLGVGQTAHQWCLAYCAHLRETAAGRDPDGELASERARVARATAERIERANAVARGEFAPVATLELALGHVARQLVSRLDAVVPQLRRTMPDVPPAVLGRIADELAACRALCASANLAAHEQSDDDGEDHDTDHQDAQTA